jgi:hypothetical protein
VLDRQPSNVIITCVATFEPSPSFAMGISAAAAKVCRRLENPQWISTSNSFTIRNVAPQLLCSIHFNQVVFQSLGFDAWEKRLSLVGETALDAFEELQVKSIKRLDIRAQAYLDLQMSHSEMVDLMFGTFLNYRGGLSSFGDLDDNAVIIMGTSSGFKFRLHVLPQTEEHVKTSINAIPNLDFFGEDRLTDTQVQLFFSKVLGSDRLCVDASIFAESEPPSAVPALVKRSASLLDEIVGRAVRFLRSVEA